MDLLAVYQGVIIYAGFDFNLWGAEVRCRDNGEQGALVRQPLLIGALGAWLGVWSCIVGQVPQCTGLHLCSMEIPSKVHGVYHNHGQPTRFMSNPSQN